MPEGDTIYRAATTLRKALLGKEVTRFDSPLPQVAEMARRHDLLGRTISQVEPRGKHLLITFTPTDAAETNTDLIPAPPAPTPDTQHLTPDTRHPPPSRDLLLHTHLRMTGSWHVYRTGEPWQKPERQAKVVVGTADWVAPCFNAPVVELLTRWQADRHPDLVSLGPDAMTDEFDQEEARRRLRRRPDVEIGVGLLDQRAFAGVGNVYKSEVLFIKRVSPFLKIGELSDETLDELLAESHRLLLLNRNRGARRTVFGLNERDLLWVYGRSGEPCRVCGETVRMRQQGIDARSTYYCPRCQA